MEIDEKQFNELFDKYIDSYATQNQFNVSKIPAHTHNGVDSSTIDPSNLTNARSYFAINTVTLSSAQILALKDTPITIVPNINTGSLTPSTTIGTVIIVEGITAKIIYGGTAYAGANNLEFRYTNAAGTKVTADIAAAFINTAASQFAHVAGIVTAFTPVQNTPIVVCVPVANPTTGNSKIVLVVKYRVVAI